MHPFFLLIVKELFYLLTDLFHQTLDLRNILKYRGNGTGERGGVGDEIE